MRYVLTGTIGSGRSRFSSPTPRLRPNLLPAPRLIVGKKNLPAKDLKELIAWLKANPGKA